MAHVHSSAVVDPAADLGHGVVIGPFCVVGPGVRIGERTELVAHVNVTGNTVIGAENRIFPQAVIGTMPQDLKYRGGNTACRIGDRNTIREGVTVNAGTEEGGGETVIGDDNLLMAYCHVAHDCLVGNGVIMANGVLLGGHIAVDDHAVIGGNAALQHYASVGTMAFVGGMSRVVHDAPPYLITEGNPARPRGVNQVKLQRVGVPAATVELMWEVYRDLYRSGAFHSALSRWELEDAAPAEVRELTRFLRATLDGRRGRGREALRPELHPAALPAGAEPGAAARPGSEAGAAT